MVVLTLTSFHSPPRDDTESFTSAEGSHPTNEEKPQESQISGCIDEVTETVENVEEISEAEEAPKRYTEREIEMLAKVVLAEAGACAPDEQRLIVWTVFQRIDSDAHDFRNMNTIEETVTAPYQFAYRENSPIIEDIYQLCLEEAEKWNNGEDPPTVDPYAPATPYYFYNGDGLHNWFRAEW